MFISGHCLRKSQEYVIEQPTRYDEAPCSFSEPKSTFTSSAAARAAAVARSAEAIAARALSSTSDGREFVSVLMSEIGPAAPFFTDGSISLLVNLLTWLGPWWCGDAGLASVGKIVFAPLEGEDLPDACLLGA